MLFYARSTPNRTNADVNKRFLSGGEESRLGARARRSFILIPKIKRLNATLINGCFVSPLKLTFQLREEGIRVLLFTAGFLFLFMKHLRYRICVIRRNLEWLRLS